MNVFLIRHGETSGNRDRIVQTPNTNLSDTGETQAHLLGEAYKKSNITDILTSDYTRAMITAQNLNTHLGCDISESAYLRERNFGDLRGKSYDDIDLALLSEDSSPPNGETQAQFIQRITCAWEFIIEHAGQTEGDLAVVSHGLFIRYLLTHVLKVVPKSVEQHAIRNTSVTKLEINNTVNVTALFDASHLKSLSGSSLSKASKNLGIV